MFIARRFFPALQALLLVTLLAIIQPSQAEPPLPVETPALDWTLLRTIPRLPNHFTQGLVFSEGKLFESTGRYGQSRLIAYDATNLEMLGQHFLRTDVFAEGLTVLDGKLYQSSWKSGEIFVYDLDMKPLHVIRISGDSWGLTSDGRSLIMSDGSDSLQFLDPHTSKIQRRITVHDSNGQARSQNNELEWLDGNILTNVWHTDSILLIDPKTGRVKGYYNLEKLAPVLRQHMPARNGEQVLNGMAWNPATKTLLVTGKDWPVWFELEIQLH